MNSHSSWGKVRVLGKMMILQCIYQEPCCQTATTKEKVFIKAIEKDAIACIDSFVCQYTKKIDSDRSVVLFRDGTVAYTYHTVEQVVLALAGEKSEVGFRQNPSHGYTI
jgi:hypothetical protein